MEGNNEYGDISDAALTVKSIGLIIGPFLLALLCLWRADDYYTMKWVCYDAVNDHTWDGVNSGCDIRKNRYGDLTRDEIIGKQNLYNAIGILLVVFSVARGFITTVEWQDKRRVKSEEEKEKEIKEANEEKERQIKEANEEKERQIKEATLYFQKGGLANFQKASDIYTSLSLSIPREIREEIAKEKEKLLDFKGALSIFEELEMHQDAKRIRQKMRDEGKVKVDQTVVHGDYVDDRDTIVKDSVVNKSNIGAGGKSKAEEIKEIKELLDSGAINEDDYEKMKREIIG